jgi:hypothetical protein
VITWVNNSEILFHLERAIVSAKSRLLRGVVFSEAALEVRALLEHEFAAKRAREAQQQQRAASHASPGLAARLRGCVSPRRVAGAPGDSAADDDGHGIGEAVRSRDSLLPRPQHRGPTSPRDDNATSMSQAVIINATFERSGVPRGAFWEATSPREEGRAAHPLTPRASVGATPRVKFADMLPGGASDGTFLSGAGTVFC